jgi:DNA-binding MarR family transcriptional regulator
MPKPYFHAEDFNCRQSLGYLTRRIQNLTNPHAEAIFADQELSFTQWISLMGLREGVAKTSADLARHLNHDTGAVTRMVDQLEKRGFIKRERSKSDRRVVHLILTPRGRAVAKSFTPHITDFWNGVMDEFSHAEITTLIQLLTRLMTRLEAEPLSEAGAPERKRAVK